MNSDLVAQFQTLQEFVVAARDRLTDHPWNYIVGGTETETAQRRNRQALDSLALRPRVFNDVSQVDCSARLCGVDARLPWCFVRSVGWSHSMPMVHSVSRGLQNRSVYP